MRTHTTLAALTAAVLVATAAPSGAQSLALGSAPPVGPNAREAQRLHDQAEQLSAKLTVSSRMTHRQLREISDLHAREAELRDAGDAAAVDCLRMAANLVHSFDPARSAELMEQAGDRALARGDVFSAARSYLDLAALQQTRKAVNVKQRMELNASALEFGLKAELLLNSPQLSDADRAALRRRFQDRKEAPRLASQ